MTHRPRVVLDTCSIWGNYPRDWVLTLAVLGHLDIFWCERILDALRRHLIPRRVQNLTSKLMEREGLDEEVARIQANEYVTPRIERTLELMRLHFPDALITDHQWKPHLSQCHDDPDDRHVLACALARNCEVIVTENVSDFSTSALAPHGIEARTLDAFLASMLQEALLEAIKVIVERHERPPHTCEELLETMRDHYGLRAAYDRALDLESARARFFALLQVWWAKKS